MTLALHADHPCHVPGCRERACYGSTRPGGLRLRKAGDVTVWACDQHRAEATTKAAELMGYTTASPADRPKAPRNMRENMQDAPVQGVLL